MSSTGSDWFQYRLSVLLKKEFGLVPTKLWFVMLLMWSVVMPCLAIVSATAFLNRDAEPSKFVALDSVIVNAEIAREYNKHDGFISARHIKPLDQARGVATILEGGGGGRSSAVANLPRMGVESVGGRRGGVL